LNIKKRIKKRKKKVHFEDLALPHIQDSLMIDIAKMLSKKIDQEVFERKYAPTKEILKLVGAGVFLAASIAIPNLPLVLKPFLSNDKEFEAWKRFNIPYLKRTLYRLEKQRCVEIGEKDGAQVVSITDRGKKRILKFVFDELEVDKPKSWDRKWRLVSYDIPASLKNVRNIVREYLKAWGFYSLHESVFLHAYPCEKQVEFLREYLGIAEFVRIFRVAEIENDKLFRDFFGV